MSFPATPCPFCGKTKVHLDNRGGESRVTCSNCFAAGPPADLVSGEEEEGELKALAAWKIRTGNGPEVSRSRA